MRNTETALGAKLKEKGIYAHNIALQRAVHAFQEKGGTYETARIILDAAYEKTIEDPGRNGDKPKVVLSKNRPSDGERASPADKASVAVSPSDTETREKLLNIHAELNNSVRATGGGGAGQSEVADKAINREPRPTPQSYKDAAKRGAKKLAETILDSYKVRDGRSIGDVQFCELERMRMDNAQEASLIRQIQRYAANVQGDAKVRDVVKAEELEKMIQRAAEVADAA